LLIKETNINNLKRRGGSKNLKISSGMVLKLIYDESSRP
jgi:hypothetical protein